jgi:hypothetical protein
MPRKRIHKVNIQNAAVLLGAMVLFFFSFFLMFQTFSYDSGKNEIVMSSHLWSDFGAHIPLIRSFSFGANWPPEYPLFPGEKIRYHFLFYLIAGLLERIGLRLDFAVNIPSALGFFGLLAGIYVVGTVLFKRKSIGILGILFFLFNGTLSFLNFIKTHPISFVTPKDIATATKFPSFGPWDKNWVSAFWNLNVYTNQRHLAFSFAIVIALILLVITVKKSKTHTSVLTRFFPVSSIRNLLLKAIAIGLLTSSLLFINQAALLVICIYFVYFFLFSKESRVPLFLAGVLSLPFLLLFQSIANPTGTPVFQPGFLTPDPKLPVTFVTYWIHNLGIHLLIIPLGIIVSPKPVRRMAIPLFILFLLPNLLRFSTDMINNHKIFNFFYIMGYLYSAAAIVWIWDTLITVKYRSSRSENFSFFRVSGAIIITGILIFFSTLSGIIDFFVVINDYHLVLSDVPGNAAAQFVRTTIPPKAIVLNNTWFYDPASLAGRPIYNGYAFFTWSAGYDTYKREAVVKTIYHATTKEEACPILAKEHIQYVEVNAHPDDYVKPISTLWTNSLTPMYQTPDHQISFFNVKNICQ